MTPAELSVIGDRLRELGLDEPTVERMLRAADPSAFVLGPTTHHTYWGALTTPKSSPSPDPTQPPHRKA